MPKTDRPLYGDSATGEIAGAIAFKNDINWCRIERKRTAAKSRTAGQGVQRNAYQTAKNFWLALTDEERAAWQSSAPNPWTGYNYYLNLALRSWPLFFGEIVFAEDVLKQGNEEGGVASASYENNFPDSADVLPVFTDGTDNFQAWLFNKLKLSVLAVEGYLIFNKDVIERS